HDGSAYLARTDLLANYDWEGRIRELRAGLNADPTYAYLANQLSYNLASVGRLREALAMGQHGLALNDLYAGSNYMYAKHLSDAGRYADARDAFDRTVRRWPESWTRIS